jgi:hypothetical protein
MDCSKILERLCLECPASGIKRAPVILILPANQIHVSIFPEFFSMVETPTVNPVDRACQEIPSERFRYVLYSGFIIFFITNLKAEFNLDGILNLPALFDKILILLY